MHIYVCIVASSNSLVHSTKQPDPVPDATSTLEMGSDEVSEILKAKGMIMKYNDSSTNWGEPEQAHTIRLYTTPVNIGYLQISTWTLVMSS